MAGVWFDGLVPAYLAIGGGAIAFYIAVVLIGSYLMMNLFVAVLLNAFSEHDEEEEEEVTSDWHGANEGQVASSHEQHKLASSHEQQKEASHEEDKVASHEQDQVQSLGVSSSTP